MISREGLVNDKLFSRQWTKFFKNPCFLETDMSVGGNNKKTNKTQTGK